MGEPFDAGTAIRRQLRAGESVLWLGRPDPSVTFAAADAYLVPFTLLWGGFSIFWLATAVASGADAGFSLFGVPFVCVGVYMIFGRFLYKRWRKDRTAYAITTQRAIVVVGQSKIDDAPVRNQPTSIRQSRDGRHGSIEFGASGGRWNGPSYANTGMEFFGRSGPQVGMYDVADFEALRRAVDEAQAG